MTDTHTIATAGRWLSFLLGGQWYATPLAQVSEVIRDEELTPVPGSAPDLLGIRHLRGRIVPVLDGRRRLGLPEAVDGDDTGVRLVMLAYGAQLVGLRVDAVGDLISPDTIEVAPPLPGGAPREDDPVHGVLPWQGSFVALLDVRLLCRLPMENEAA